MNAAELEALLIGLLRLWSIEATVAVTRQGEGLTARVDGAEGIVVTVEQIRQPFGIAWHVQVDGERRRAYPSTIGVIRHLRSVLAPERGAARVLFAAGSRA